MENEKKEREFSKINNVEVAAILYALEVALEDIAVPVEALAASAIATLLVAENGERTGDDIRFKGNRVAELFIHSIMEIARHLSDEMESSIQSQKENEDLQ